MGGNERESQERAQAKGEASPGVTDAELPLDKVQIQEEDGKPPAKKARSGVTEPTLNEARTREGHPPSVPVRALYKLPPVNPSPDEAVPWELAEKPFLRGAQETFEQFVEAKYHWQFLVASALGVPKYKGVLVSPKLLSASRTRLWKPKTVILVREVLRRSHFLELDQVPRRFEDTSFRKPRPQNWNRERLIEWLEQQVNNSLWSKNDLEFIDNQMKNLFKELQPVGYLDRTRNQPKKEPAATIHRPNDSPQTLKVAVPQLAPCWFNRAASTNRVLATIEIAASKQKADLIVFPEAIIPGYPYWLSEDSKLTSDQEKELHLLFSSQAVVLEEGHLGTICNQLRACKMACYLGIMERPSNRHSLYSSMVHISKQGVVLSVQRKLCPSRKESLVMTPGDGKGLIAHKVGRFTVGGLTSGENWMPLTRAALYAQAEDVHVASWPGSHSMTKDITRMIAREGRSYVISVGAIMRQEDVMDNTPFADEIREFVARGNYDGGCCVAAPDGTWVLPLEPGVQSLRYCVLDPAVVRKERLSFDPTEAYYSRPDVLQLTVHRERQTVAKFEQ